MKAKRSHILRLLVLGLGLTGLGGCAGTPAEPASAATAPLRFKEWWNFYERGLARMAARDWAGAQADFETALGLRSGARFENDQDSWRTRTYGMHFIPSYFPNRELGITLLEQGDLAGAARCLETSLRQTPSGRARHFLTRVRQAATAGRTFPPPSLEIEGGTRVVWTRESMRTLRGRAHAEGYLRALRVAGSNVLVELAQNTLPFSQAVRLQRGTNRVSVSAYDLGGRSAQTNLTWIFDPLMPELVVHRLETAADGWSVSFTCSDDEGLQEVQVDGRAVDLGSAAEPARQIELTREVPAGQLVQVTATDRAGNVLRATLSPDHVADQALALEDAWAAIAESERADVEPAAASAAPSAAPSDGIRPRLKLGAFDQEILAYTEDYFIDGTATDGGGLASLTVNNQDCLGARNVGCLEKHFSVLVPLDAGTNVFAVVARDAAGNETRRELRVVSLTPPQLDSRYRLSVGIPPFYTEDTGPDWHAVKSEMVQHLSTRPARFRILEREAGWDDVLREQQLSLSDLADPGVHLRVGRMVAAEMLFMGSLIRDPGGLTVRIQTVETENGEVLFAEDVYSDDRDQDLDRQIEGLVLKLKSRFPLLEGTVTGLAGGGAAIDLGLDDGIARGSRFIVLERKGQALTVVHLGEQPVELIVEEAAADGSRAAVLPANSRDNLAVGYVVCTR